ISMIDQSHLPPLAAPSFGRFDQHIQFWDAIQKGTDDMNALCQRQGRKNDLGDISNLWNQPYGVTFDLIDVHGGEKTFADDQIGARRRQPYGGMLFIHLELSTAKTLFRIFVLRHVPEPAR